MEELLRRFERDLREAYMRGEAEYGVLPIGVDVYAESLLDKLRRRLGDDPEGIEAALRNALLDLTMRETLLLVWKFRENLSQQEMATRLEVSEARISQLMKRTVEKVRGGVLHHIQDESAPQWAAREELWAALRNVVGNLLDRQ